MKALKKTSCLAFCAVLLGFSGAAFCEAISWTKSNDISGLDKVLKEAKNTVHFRSLLGKPINSERFLAFPKKVPSSDKKMFARLETRPNYVSVLIGNSPNCMGEKACLLGALTLEPGINPSIVYDANDRKITRMLALNHHLEGYFTEEHAFGSTFPASLVWRDGPMAYTLNAGGWKLSDVQDFIIMANFIIDALHPENT